MRTYLGYAIPCGSRRGDAATSSQPGGTLALGAMPGPQPDQVTVTLLISGAPVPIGAFGCDIAFDSSEFVFLDGRPCGLDPGWLLSGANESRPAMVIAGAVGLDPLPAGSSGCLFEFVFACRGDTESTGRDGFVLGGLTDDLADWR